jgi:hypothetical protein
MTGLAVVVRALELDPLLGERGPRVALMTAGSLIPALALHPAAEKLRREVRRLALEPTVLWVDCQAREDFMNFWNFDPVAGSGVEVGAARRNPRIWHVPFTDMLSPEFYKRARWNFFRMHFQYIMANQRRTSYDYFMFVCGHVPFVEWVARGALPPTLDPGHSRAMNVEADHPAPEEVAQRIARELGS